MTAQTAAGTDTPADRSKTAAPCRSGLVLALSLSAALACSKAYRAPAPLPKIALPSGAALKPFDANNPSGPHPQGMTFGGDQRPWVALTNLDASFSPGGPGFLVGFTPSSGKTTAVDLGGTDGHQCTNSGYVKNDGGNLLVTCTGSFNFGTGPAELRGRGVVEVDPGSGTVSRRASAPEGFQPSAVAGAAHKIWVGDTASARIFSLDRVTFAVADGADAAHPAIALPCPAAFTFVSDLLVVGGDLFALCGASEGYLVRLDAQTGAAKGDKVLVGATPVALTLTGDNRLAVANSVDGTIALVAYTDSTMTAQRAALTLAHSSAPQDVRARNNFLYTVSSGTQTVQKIDLAAPGGPKVVAEVNTGNNSFPWNIAPLDDDQAVVSNSGTGEIAGVKFVTTP